MLLKVIRVSIKGLRYSYKGPVEGLLSASRGAVKFQRRGWQTVIAQVLTIRIEIYGRP